jgi:hypothetical protein
MTNLNHAIRFSFKSRVLAIIRQHQGHDHAIRAMDLARELGLTDDRKVQLAIEDLIEEGTPVCSSCSHPMGYYLPVSAEEAEEYKRQLRSRAIGNYHRYKNFKVAFGTWFNGAQQRRLL